jgi:hypothetical protein
MYINYSLLRQLNLSVSFIPILFAANQNRNNDESETLSNEAFTDDLRQLFELGILEQVKAKKKSDTVFNLIRLSTKGKKILEDITTPDVLEEHLKMRDYLISIYLNHEDKERVVGNKKLIAIYISVLQAHLGIDIYRFYYLCEFFLSEHIFTKKLENIFMDRNKIRYGDFKNHIEDSSIFQFYEQREDEVKEYWRTKIKTD